MIIAGNAKYIPDFEFKIKIQKAFELLRTKASSEFGIVASIVDKICAAEKSGADVWNSTIEIARPTFDSSTTWLASVLVHEACHIVQYKASSDFIGKKAEQECNVIQLRALRLIGASQFEIAHMLSQTGDHGDMNGDGKVDMKDYELRNY